MVGKANSEAVSVNLHLACKRCKKKVVNGVKCIACDGVFHASCVKLQNNILFLNENTVQCCNDHNEDEDDDGDSVSNGILSVLVDDQQKVDVKVVKFIIKQNNLLIKELREKVSFLSNHVELLNKLVILPEPHSKTGKHSAGEIDDKLRCTDSGIRQEEQCMQTHSIINSQSGESKQTYTGNSSQDTCPSDPNDNTPGPTATASVKWTDVVKKNKSKRPIVIGRNTGSDKTENKLKGVPKITSLHVYRLDPETTTDCLVANLKSSFPEISCEKLNSKHPESYSSFKVNLYEKHLERASDPDLWPTDCCVRRFLHLRPQNDRLASINNERSKKDGSNN